MKFTIYQIKETPECFMFAFRGWDRSSKSFNFDNYKEVWTDNLNNLVDEVSSNDIDNIEVIFNIFNVHHPKNYRGHSLSVSDIVKLDNKYYYCDSFGWKEITDNI